MAIKLMKIIFINLFITFILFPLVCFGSTPFYFEKGDAAYRNLASNYFPPSIQAIGHTGIYGIWTEYPPTDPMDQTVLEMETNGLHVTDNFQMWINEVGLSEIWGGKGLVLQYDQRNALIQLIMDIKNNPYGGADYGGVPGIYDLSYKDPLGVANTVNPGKPSFRCDGLVEYAYEVILGEPWIPGNNGGLYIDDDVPQTILDLKNYFNPKNQYLSTRWQIIRNLNQKASPPQLTIKDSSNNTIPDGGTTSDKNISVYATDTNYGSGLSLLEVWQGDPNNAGTLLKSFSDDYDVDNTYSSSDIGTLPDGEIYVRCFDQAGNDILHHAVGVSIPFLVELEKARFAKIDRAINNRQIVENSYAS